MTRPWILALFLAVALASRVFAFETSARIRRIDAEKRIAQVFAGGQDRTVRIAPNARVLDEQGKDLPGGLAAKELREGALVTLTVERGDGGPVITVIRLGAREPVRGEGPRRVDTSAFKPLPELGAGQYQGFAGGLYPGGKNERPAAHEALGVALARQVQPLDRGGKPDPNGKIVLLSIGMSNTTHEFSAFQALANRSPEKSPKVAVVDGAQGGMTAAVIQNPDDGGRGAQYWRTVDQRLAASGVTRAQVQAAWLKEADAAPSSGFPAYARTLQAELGRIVRLLHDRFPNLKLVYLSPRTYGGYAKSALNPEPYAYESGFAVKWLIEQQLQGDPELNCDPKKGAVKAPWLSWGPYLWANGERPNRDGLAYVESDFGGDGTHPSDSGRAKVAGLLWKHFTTDTTARGWFVGR